MVIQIQHIKLQRLALAHSPLAGPINRTSEIGITRSEHGNEISEYGYFAT